MIPPPILPTLEVGDSRFVGYSKSISVASEAIEFQNSIQQQFPSAAHVSVCWLILFDSTTAAATTPSTSTNNTPTTNSGIDPSNAVSGFDEDGEPPNSTGPFLLQQIHKAVLLHYHNCTQSSTSNNGTTSSSIPNNSAATTKDDDDDNDNDNDKNNVNINETNNHTPTNNKVNGIVLVIVRFFGHQLLGVTCGRLSQCYASIARLTLHRHFQQLHHHGSTQSLPLVRHLSWDDAYHDIGDIDLNDCSNTNGEDTNTTTRSRQQNKRRSKSKLPKSSKYGLAAGDCEILIVPNLLDNYLQPDAPSSPPLSPSPNADTHNNNNNNTHIIDKEKRGNNTNNSNTKNNKIQWIRHLARELQFDGFRGNTDQKLPRLQNLQAAMIPSSSLSSPSSQSPSSSGNNNNNTIPVYRYPGNYHGDEWQTYPWNSTVLQIKHTVEQAIQSTSSTLYPTIEFNHCVTNYYRSHDDFIGHHSDKDLDLDKSGVIVSVSLGDERVLELRRRKGRSGEDPQDVTRVALPHGSILVLGPRTNQTFTHSILVKETNGEEEEEEGSRMEDCSISSGSGSGNTDDDDEAQRLLTSRISLTFRTVTTFMDLKTGRLFGEGAADDNLNSVEDVRHAERKRDIIFFSGFIGGVSSLGVSALAVAVIGGGDGGGSSIPILVGGSVDGGDYTNTMMMLVFVSVDFGIVALLSFISFRKVCAIWNRKREETNARDFFSKASVNGTKYS